MSKLIIAAKVSTINKIEEFQGIEAVAQSQANSEPGTRQSSRFSRQYFRCHEPYMLKNCKEQQKFPVTCYEYREKGHIVRFYHRGNGPE